MYGITTVLPIKSHTSGELSILGMYNEYSLTLIELISNYVSKAESLFV